MAKQKMEELSKTRDAVLHALDDLDFLIYYYPCVLETAGNLRFAIGKMINELKFEEQTQDRDRISYPRPNFGSAWRVR